MSEVSRLKRFFPSRSDAVRAMLRVVEKVVAHPVNVLILGETGAGKDYLASALHLSGPRRAKPFVTIDCASVPHELFESELFGYEKGAFTDAKERKRGKLEEAAGGSLYLDEIGALDERVQPKLLRAVQERVFTRLGSSRAIPLDVQLLASTTLSIAEMSRGEGVRSDLFHRLNVVSVVVPPLRERREDIAMLARQFLKQISSAMNVRATEFHPDVLEFFAAWDWPGNLRELRNVVERAALITSAEVITVAALPPHMITDAETLVRRGGEQHWTLEEVERRYIEQVIGACDGNYSKAAERLGINRKTLLEKRKKYGIE